jgi:DNA-binding NarL/FixJ family response regulator
MKQNIRIMLIEDHPEYREVIELALNKEPDMELSGTFGSAEGALNRLQHGNVRTDVILLDLNLPGLNGLDALPLLVQAAPEAKVIILTQSDKERDVLRSITLGAAGYLLKSGSRRQITEGIRLVMAGGATLDAGIARFILKTLQTHLPQQQASSDTLLSKREMEILTLLAEGLVQKEIALKLNISTTTVVTHINHIYLKLNVTNAPAAINKAHLSGLFNL